MLNTILFLFFAAPISAFIWFLVALVRYLLAPRFSPQRQSRKQNLFTSAIACSTLFFVLFALFILFAMGIANM